MVAADDLTVDAVVLTEGGVEQSFTGTSVTHIERVAGLDDEVFHKVLVNEGVDALDADFSRGVTGLQVADEGVDDNAITHFDSNLGEVFVRTVHGVAELQGSNLGPATLVHFSTELSRSHIGAGELGGELTLRENLNLTSKVEGLLGENHLHTRMVGGSNFPELLGIGAMTLEDLLAFVLLVFVGHFVALADLHGSVDRAIADEGNFLAGLDILGIFSGDVHGDRNRPEGAVGEQHVIADALPVGLVHEAIERREAADTHHDEVALGARRNFNLFQAFGFLELIFKSFSFEQAADEAFSTMRGHELGHNQFLHNNC